MNYFFNVWSALSQLVNAIVGGVPVETVSGRAYRTNSWLRSVINTILFFQKDHCLDAHNDDVNDAYWLIDNKKMETGSSVVITPEVRDADWFKEQPFETQLELIRSGEWIEKGLSDFFAQQWDQSVPEEKRIAIAKAHAFRYGVPYVKPTKTGPTKQGMGDDGNQNT
jgi:hypothetical protein